MGSLNFSFSSRRWLASLLIFLSGINLVQAAETADPAPAADTNLTVSSQALVQNAAEVQQALHAYLHLQAQLKETLMAIEQNRKESEKNWTNTEAATLQNAEILASRLKLIESALTRQAEAAKDSSSFALMVAAALGGIGLLVMLFTAWFLMRTARQFSELTALTNHPALPHLGPAGLLSDASGTPLLGAIERLERRIHDIEASAGLPHVTAETSTGDHRLENPEITDPKDAQVALLLGKGQSLLHLDQAENAIKCFDEALALDPKNTEAYVKKGAAFERLRRLEDAIGCYDRAIAVDDSMTLAYLYKGGVFNQLERFGEALQCYEKALRAQQKFGI